MGKNKDKFEEVTATEEAAPLDFDKGQLYQVADPKSRFYGQNVRIMAILEPGLEGEEFRIKFQYQIPRGPGRPAETSIGCPHCKYGKEEGATFHLSATQETPTKNEVRMATKAELKKLLKEIGARLVEV